jgi:putative glutamine amidotransferase
MAELMSGRSRRIGISQRHWPAEAKAFDRDGLDSAWANWLSKQWPTNSFLALPNFEAPSQLLAYVEHWQLNAFILSGGGDARLSARRVANEAALLDHAEQHRLPVLGVCRGMQVLHLRSGGALCALKGHVRSVHAVNGRDVNMLVNSWHEFGIDALTPSWEALARASDGSVEAMRHKKLPWIGLMWHPERDQGDSAVIWPWIAHAFSQPSEDLQGNST